MLKLVTLNFREVKKCPCLYRAEQGRRHKMPQKHIYEYYNVQSAI